MQQEEIWKDIPDYKGVYQVSNLGRVKSFNFYKRKTEKILKQCVNSSRYYSVSLCKNRKCKNYNIHQLVAMTFLKHNPCGYKLVVNHKNFNKLDNRVENLEIITQRENANRKHCKGSSEYTGVCWHKRRKKWQSSILVNKKKKYLGYFNTEIEASNAYKDYLFNIYNKIDAILRHNFNPEM